MGWRFLFPPAQWLRAYGLKWLQSKALAGLTTAWAITALAGVMYVANPQRIGNVMWRLIYEYKPRVAIDRSTIPDFEYTPLKILTEADKKLERSGVALRLAANPEPLRPIQKSELGKTLRGERMFFNPDHTGREESQAQSSLLQPEMAKARAA